MNGNRALLIAALLISGHAFAAESPATTVPGTKPAVVVREAGGSTIVGEQDSAMGLTLMPWKEEFSTGLDQPPSLYRAPLTSVDSRSLQRQTETRDDLTNYRRSHSQYTP